ncbi:phosphatases II [Hypoxylon trugodes]|uniref:phosphatases II n=1 Tax=Hypoxylon trugodes TaxID=326681 RepID=UPI00218F66E8|nr:phosphatases II [Hypoxylon trugodes]KAI1385536.1 phosphatases II [Hypoxylon trugodes]
MDQFSARFRRPRRTTAAPATPPMGNRTGSPPDRSSSERKLAAFNQQHEQREQPPQLTISTTNHTSNNNNNNTCSPRTGLSSKSPLSAKSPFRGFHFRHSNKRARSPASATLPVASSPAITTPSGIEYEKLTPISMQSMQSMESQDEMGAPQGQPKPKIPAFLNLTPNEIESKFQDLNWAERLRLQSSWLNPSPNAQFARINSMEAKSLDRYANIQPWANNRVKLQVPDGQLDYINASPIVLHSPIDPEGKPPHRYIAMQGPKVATMEHVWRMVAEQLQSPAVIVMLTETHEGGMEKCYPYFPRVTDHEPWEIGEEDEFGDGFHAQLKCDSIEEHANGAIEVRKLILHVEGREEDMIVWHLLYRKWPDFGVPAIQDIDSFFELMRLSREKNASVDNPRIIHCSAGVGRSGTFIALEHLIREIDTGDLDRFETEEVKDKHNTKGKDSGDGDDEDDEEVDLGKDDIIYKTVNALREQRKQMVQAESQYLFIYQVLRKLWLEKHGLAEADIEEPAAKRLEVDNDPFI